MANTENIEAKLAAYVDGELDAGDRAEIEQHLAANPQHRKLIEELREARRFLKELPHESAPAEVAEMLNAQLERAALLGDVEIGGSGAGSEMRISRWTQIRAIAAVLVLTLGLAGLIYWVLPSPKTAPQQVAVVTPESESPGLSPLRAASPPDTIRADAPGGSVARRSAGGEMSGGATNGMAGGGAGDNMIARRMSNEESRATADGRDVEKNGEKNPENRAPEARSGRIVAPPPEPALANRANETTTGAAAPSAEAGASPVVSNAANAPDGGKPVPADENAGKPANPAGRLAMSPAPDASAANPSAAAPPAAAPAAAAPAAAAPAIAELDTLSTSAEIQNAFPPDASASRGYVLVSAADTSAAMDQVVRYLNDNKIEYRDESAQREGSQQQGKTEPPAAEPPAAEPPTAAPAPNADAPNAGAPGGPTYAREPAAPAVIAQMQDKTAPATSPAMFNAPPSQLLYVRNITRRQAAELAQAVSQQPAKQVAQVLMTPPALRTPSAGWSPESQSAASDSKLDAGQMAARLRTNEAGSAATTGAATGGAAAGGASAGSAAAGGAAAGGASAGGAAAGRVAASAPAATTPAMVVDQTVPFEPGDVLRYRFAGAASERVTVDQDGNAMIGPFGLVRAAGLTPAELAETLTARSSPAMQQTLPQQAWTVERVGGPVIGHLDKDAAKIASPATQPTDRADHPERAAHQPGDAAHQPGDAAHQPGDAARQLGEAAAPTTQPASPAADADDDRVDVVIVVRSTTQPIDATPSTPEEQTAPAASQPIPAK